MSNADVSSVKRVAKHNKDKRTFSSASAMPRNILPRTAPSANVIVIPKEFKGNIVFNTSHHYHAPAPPAQPRFILPKPHPVAFAPQHAPVVRSDFGVQAGVEVADMFSSNAVQTDSKQLHTAETQTFGDVILTQAMQAGQVPFMASPVTPQPRHTTPRRKRAKPAKSVTSETQTVTSQSLLKRRRRNAREKCDMSVNTDTPKVSRDRVSHRPLHPSVAVQEIQTDAECVTSLPSLEDIARTAESISTQTQDSFLSHHQQQQVMRARDSEMQTRLHMHMTVDACTTHDVRSLQAIGLGPNTPVSTPTVDASPHANPLIAAHPMRFVTSDASHLSHFDDPTLMASSVPLTSSASRLFDVSVPTPSMLDDVINDIQTQTSDIGVGDDNVDDEFWRNFDLIDSHTQTNDALTPASFSMTSPTDMTSQQQQHVEIQASIHHMTSQGADVVSSDIETQTLFGAALTDSHTQTSWKDLMQIVGNLE